MQCLIMGLEFFLVLILLVVSLHCTNVGGQKSVSNFIFVNLFFDPSQTCALPPIACLG